MSGLHRTKAEDGRLLTPIATKRLRSNARGHYIDVFLWGNSTDFLAANPELDPRFYRLLRPTGCVRSDHGVPGYAPEDG